jgi:zinc transport system substrate-binding protein
MICLFLTALLLGGCQQKPTPIQEKTILVSIAPYAFFVHRIAGEDLAVMTLIPEGANPHLYEPTPKEVEKIRGAKLWVRLGESFDDKVLKVMVEQNPDMQIVPVTDGITLLSSCEEEGVHHNHSSCSHSNEGKDFHIWLSPRLAKTQAQTIAQALIESFPEHRATYESRLQAFLEELDQLDREIVSLLADRQGDAILVSHPSFAYFCRDYGLVQLSVETEGKDPLPQQVTALLEEARRYQVSIVFLEPQFSNKGAVLIADRLNVPTVMVDPLSQDYLDNLRSIAHIIAKSPRDHR